MMRPTQHHQIVEFCFTVMHPVHNMMHLAGTRRPITPRMGASTVPNRDRFTLRRRGAPFLPAHVQWFTDHAEDDRGDLGVAAEPAYLTRPDVSAEFEVRPAQSGLERFQAHGDRHVRAFPSLCGEAAFVEGVCADLPERISLPLTE